MFDNFLIKPSFRESFIDFLAGGEPTELGSEELAG